MQKTQRKPEKFCSESLADKIIKTCNIRLCIRHKLQQGIIKVYMEWINVDTARTEKWLKIGEIYDFVKKCTKI